MRGPLSIRGQLIPGTFRNGVIFNRNQKSEMFDKARKAALSEQQTFADDYLVFLEHYISAANSSPSGFHANFCSILIANSMPFSRSSP